jgi:hypothetical protein
MPVKSKPEYSRLKMVLSALLAVGLILAELGQNYVSSWGDRSPGRLFIYACVPYLLLAFGTWVLARSRADHIILLICTVPITLAKLLLFDKPDVLGLIHILVPVDSIMLAIAALVVVIVRVWVGWWMRRGKKSATTVPDSSLRP